MARIVIPPHNLTPVKVDLARKKLVELKESNIDLYTELIKLSLNGFDAVYIEMKNRAIL